MGLAYLTEARFRLSVARALRARTDVAASAAVERLEAPLRLPAFAACRRATAELAAAAGSSADRFELALQCDPVGACAAALESTAAASNRERRKCARAGRRALFNLAIINTVP